MTFDELIRRSRKEGVSPYGGTLLCLDPGQTTGYAVFEGTFLKDCGQLDTREVNIDALQAIQKLLDTHKPQDCIYEDYRVYKWRVQQHANSELHTPKLIGMIQTACMLTGVEQHKQMAVVAKQFATDPRLKEWGFYEPMMRHANDAIRHGCYFIAFGPPNQKPTHKRRSQHVG